MSTRLVIDRRYEMEVAHRLTAGVPEKHRCRRPHGHRYVMTLSVSGTVDADGIVIEYGDLDAVVRPVVKLVDHHDLNTLPERCSTAAAASVGQNPTVERLAIWFHVRLAGLVASARSDQALWLDEIRIEEDSRSQCVLRCSRG